MWRWVGGGVNEGRTREQAAAAAERRTRDGRGDYARGGLRRMFFGDICYIATRSLRDVIYIVLVVRGGNLSLSLLCAWSLVSLALLPKSHLTK